jgi:hypothetical protein
MHKASRGDHSVSELNRHLQSVLIYSPLGGRAYTEALCVMGTFSRYDFFGCGWIDI